MGCLINHRYMGGSTRTPGSGGCNISTPHSDSLNSNVFSVFGWVYPITPNEGGGSNSLIRKTAFTTAGGYYVRFLGTLSSKVNFGIFGATGESQIESDVALPKKQWSHVICEFDETGTMRIYENNDLKKSSGAGRAYIPHPSASVIMQQGLNGNQAEWGIVNRILTAEERSALYVRGEVPSGAVRFYPLDDLPSTYIDTIGGNNGTGTATTYSTDTPVQMRTAIDMEARSSLSFDGVDDYVAIGDNIINATDSVTIDCLFYAKSVTGNQRIFDVHGKYSLALTGSSLSFVLFGLWVGTGVTISKNTWYRVTATYDKQYACLYINGMLVARDAHTNNFPAGTETLEIGRYSASQYFNGLVKYARAWKNTILTLEEIKDLSFRNIVPYKGQKDILVLDLTLNEGAGATVYDQSGNGNHGTLTGCTWSAELPNAPRVPIGGNMVKNGSFDYVPVVNVPTTTSGRWIDGTAGGSTSVETGKLFKWYVVNRIGTATFGAKLNPGSLELSVSAQSSGWVVARLIPTGGTGWGLFPQYIPVKPNTEYKLSCDIEIIGAVSSSYGVNVNITEVSGSGAGITGTDVSVSNLTGTTQKIRYERTFTTQSNARYCDILASMRDTTGTAIFSNISLLPTTPVVNIPLSAPAVAITCP